jgi:hypothetical protein
MTRSETLNEGDLVAVAEQLLPLLLDQAHVDAIERARLRVDADERLAMASGVKVTPTFFINGGRYEGPWDASSLSDAMLGTLDHRVRTVTLNFARWGSIRRSATAIGNGVGHYHLELAFGAGFRSVLETGSRHYARRNEFPNVAAALG